MRKALPAPRLNSCKSESKKTDCISCLPNSVSLKIVNLKKVREVYFHQPNIFIGLCPILSSALSKTETTSTYQHQPTDT